MLSKYVHVKGFALSNSLICHSMMFFNPITQSLYPLTGYPLTKFLTPLTKKFSCSLRISFCSGVAFKTQYASAILCYSCLSIPFHSIDFNYVFSTMYYLNQDLHVFLNWQLGVFIAIFCCTSYRGQNHLQLHNCLWKLIMC